jgi:hypothetical protein
MDGRGKEIYGVVPGDNEVVSGGVKNVQYALEPFTNVDLCGDEVSTVTR